MAVLEDILYFAPGGKRSVARSGEHGARIVVPSTLRTELLAAYHDDPVAGHLGAARVYQKLAAVAHWDSMYQDVVHWVRSCAECARVKAPRSGPVGIIMMLQPVVATRPWEMVAVDHTGTQLPVPASGIKDSWLPALSPATFSAAHARLRTSASTH